MSIMYDILKEMNGVGVSSLALIFWLSASTEMNGQTNEPVRQAVLLPSPQFKLLDICGGEKTHASAFILLKMYSFLLSLSNGTL